MTHGQTDPVRVVPVEIRPSSSSGQTVTTRINNSDYLEWFRGAAPYINAHRGKTFVIYFGGEAIADTSFPVQLHDFALLDSLGIRLVLVHGIRPQIDDRLHTRGLQASYRDGLRITDAAALECVKEAAGTARVEIEALLSMGLPNSPMAGARIRVASGNFVTARPVGIRDGVDFQHTGEVRRVDAEGIRAALNRGDIVLLSAVGYSSTGEIFNLRSEEVATTAAIALNADKLLLLGEQDCTLKKDGSLISQLTTDEACALLETPDALDAGVAAHIRAATQACLNGVERSHCLNRHTDGALLMELLTRDGIGALVSRTPFEALRPATVSDVPGILNLILPLEQQGVLVPRSQERLESSISDYSVIERDGTIIGCAALHEYPEARTGELACLVLHPDYRSERRGERLLECIEQRARQLKQQSIFVLTTQTEHWFREHGFEPARVSDLPESRQAAYNTRRNSKVLIKPLASI